MSLEGKIAVITGGSGIVGSGIVRSFLQAGATVVAPVRSENARQTLLEDVQDLSNLETQLHILVVGDYASVDGSANLANYLSSNYPTIHHIVSCFGGSFKMGTASTLTPEDIHQAMDRAIPHLLLANSLFPLLAEEATSSMTFVTGMLGERCSMPGAAALTIANAAIYGIIRALEAEHAGHPQRINELRIAALIRKDNKDGHPFVKGGKAYAASLIGEVATEVVTGQQNRDIVRIWAEDLAAREEQREKVAAQTAAS